MRNLYVIFLFLACSFSQQVFAQIPGLPVIDFQRYFPHLVAASNEVQEASYPQGVQYKFLSIRDAQENKIFVALISKERNGRVVRHFLVKGDVEGSEIVFQNVVKKFSSTTGAKFEFTDFRDVDTLSDFKARASELGWGIEGLSQ